MRLNPRLLSSAAAVAITCVVSAAAYYYKRRNTEINEVMVFCKLQFNPHNYFDKLISFIEGAKHSVHVCMPGIHNPAIQARLVNLILSKNIHVRIVVDRSGYNASTDFFIKELIEAGAEIKCKANEPINSMKHKFCLVDEKILMTGTLNWGDDRSFDHWNYVYITSKHQLVEPVKNEFNQIWNIASDVLTLFEIYCDSDAETVEILNPEDVSDDSTELGGDDRIETIDIAIDNNVATPIEKQMAQDEFKSFSMNTLL
ncbi:mitochondrial cardiolipin hydrolase-like [Maniola hyperantus]|uniref:mitochondrial cardiolipin hydrolase-like n=1 Tax=Aphantopus hyperantus TaxID=2795564 RepID=UPI001569DE09|nr:mitochondrial cardiolipin hydrolase-like [Maniola hyperantus]